MTWNDVLVAPLVGAWIEIIQIGRIVQLSQVAPLVGAWIEMIVENAGLMGLPVAPLVGAWIEIQDCHPASLTLASLPLWERGLK